MSDQPLPATLTAANTLGVAAEAAAVVTISREAQLPALVATLARLRKLAPTPLTVLGGGSNVVLRRHLPGLVCLMRTRGISLHDEVPDTTLVTAAAGESWHQLVRFCLGQGLGGLENLALIPGAVGAAPIQNIGAYGVELADRLVSLRALDLEDGRVRPFTLADCGFGYRDSIFKRPEGSRWLIVDVTLRLHRNRAPVYDYPDLRLELARLGWSRPSPVQVAEAVVRIRRRKLPDPRRIGNVGSFFKNPVVAMDLAERLRDRWPGLSAYAGGDGRIKLSAAQLIDRCGWKGRVCGAVGVWHRQPLVLVNRGGASGADILAVAEDIRRDVAERFGVELALEPRVLGQD